jgi:uncharacterized protein YndB with AHSA1/START domain
MSKTAITAEPGIPMVIVTREFDAPRDLVFRAHTDPDLLVQWLGPRDLTTAVDRYEARNGGTWRYRQTDADGNTYGFHGVFHGDPSPDGIVQTFEFEGAPGHVCLQTVTLADRSGRTLLRTVSASPAASAPPRPSSASGSSTSTSSPCTRSRSAPANGYSPARTTWS